MSNQETLDRIQQLQERHDMFDREITRVEQTHQNTTMIIDLKKKKLKIKDEIEVLKKLL